MSTAPPILLVDNSNTRTKFAMAAGGQLLPGAPLVLPTASITPEAVQHTLKGLSYSRAILCSVAPQAAATLRQHMGCPVDEVSSAACSHLLRGYAGAATLGADRMANAAAAAACYPLPCVAIDLGTACTFDVVVHEADGPRFAGGVIAPGLQTLANGPAAHTALLPPTDASVLSSEPPCAIGSCTREALRAGLHFGYLGMLRGILQGIFRALGERPCVVLTGGDALPAVARALEVDHIDKTLTFKGMMQIFQVI